MASPAPAVASSSQPHADTPPVAASRRTATSITHCPDASTCVTLADRIDSFNQTVSVDQAWALIHQSVLMYHTAVHGGGGGGGSDAAPLSAAAPLRVPLRPDGLCLHRDGSVHIVADASTEAGTTEREILLHLGYVLCTALYAPDHNPDVPPDLDEVFRIMMLEEEEEDGPDGQTVAPADAAAQTLNGVLAMCWQRVDGEPPTAGRGHYRAVCRALVMESLELRAFLRIVCKVSARRPHSSLGTVHLFD